MANNEVKLIISADGSTVVKATQEVSQAFDTLKAKTVADINQKKADFEVYYENSSKAITIQAILKNSQAVRLL